VNLNSRVFCNNHLDYRGLSLYCAKVEEHQGKHSAHVREYNCLVTIKWESKCRST